MIRTKNFLEETTELTNSIVSIYQALMELEKQNILDEEYMELLRLLPDAISYEKKLGKKVNSIDEVLKKSVGKSFKTFKGSINDLCNIRILNLLDEDNVYSLDGIVFSGKTEEKESEEIPIEALFVINQLRDIDDYGDLKYNVQELIDEAYFKRICCVLEHNCLTECERKSLIEIKYALLISSRTLEEKFLNGELRDVIFPIISESERKTITPCLISKVRISENYALDMNDDIFDKENAIAQLLYIDTCLKLMQSFCASIAEQEIINTINLNYVFGELQGASRKKICELMNKVFVKKIFDNKKMPCVEKK